MSYYNDQQKAYRAMDAKVIEAIRNGEEIDLNKLYLDLTVQHPVSLKALQKRVETYLKVHKNWRLLDNKLFDAGEEVSA